MSEPSRHVDDDGLPTDVHQRIQSAASRVQALRDATRSLGEEIARTRDAVEGSAGERGDDEAAGDVADGGDA